MKKKDYAKVIFDRKKKIDKLGYGKVEILICLTRDVKKYVTIRNCNALEWENYKHSAELQLKLQMYNDIAREMVEYCEELTVKNLNEHLGIESGNKRKKELAALHASPTGFIDFIRECIKKEKIAPKTLSRKEQVIRTIEAFGRMKRFGEVNEKNLLKFNKWLDDGTREVQSIYNYHKTLKKYTRLAYELEYIPADPYKSPKCKFSRGKSKEREPLLEEELLRIRALDKLTNYEDRARDHFVFMAYTGLSYADSQNFDFEKMTVLVGDTYFIDGSRVKTGTKFFTPILPPAMEVLKKYEYKIPKISNQKLNEWLKHIQRYANINKPMTCHVGRHSFATLILSYDVPLEDLSRMLGHTDIDTTRIYAKILQTTIARHGNDLSGRIK